MTREERIQNIHAVNEQIERCAWLNYWINLWQLPQLDREFCRATCLKYCPDWTEENAREIFNRENAKLKEMNK